MRRWRPYLAVALLTLSLNGCGDVFYFSKMGWHQGSVHFRSIPVKDLLEDAGTDAQAKEKIRFIQEVKHYGEKRLGLTATKNYTTFVQVEGPILYVVSACEKDRLKPYSWSFPVIGQVTYKSFFTREDAVNEKTVLDGRGYDTYTQRAGAYSTLGWLKDPILSSMLEWDYAPLANLILHEMTHGTIYIKGQTDFNEQAATFVGNQGSINFLTEKYGADSKEVAYARHLQEDDLLFGRWIDQACRRLTDFYERDIPRAEKVKGREAIFQFMKEEFKEIKPRLQTDTYSHFEKIPLNNAVLLAYHRYIHRLSSFGPVYDYLGRDLGRVVDFLKWIQASEENPSTYLERWMQAKGVIVPASQR
jgi:predicted aminopeptidase